MLKISAKSEQLLPLGLKGLIAIKAQPIRARPHFFWNFLLKLSGEVCPVTKPAGLKRLFFSGKHC
jgi:hypothetical protein